MTWDSVERRHATRVLVLCACRRWFEWRTAKYVGVQQDDEGRIELRNCPRCGSTRALVMETRDERNATL